ncbi:3-dehydroquinate synthase [Mariniluteicoccus flavus]
MDQQRGASAPIRVAAERAYDVEVRPGALDLLPGLMEGRDRVAILHAPVMRQVAEQYAGFEGVVLVELPDAEAAKTADVLVTCWDRLAQHGFTRSDLVVGMGGGATTDLAGFVAASWLRGVDLVTVPTTVLGMVDAAVGGKTGINIAAGKNLVGAFHEPIAVLCDLGLLETLPEADLRAGLGEVVKCGFIADPEILRLVEESPSDSCKPGSARLAELIRRGVQVKADVVSGDLRETTSVGGRVGRELLNYGHTLAHAIEKREAYRWRHGDAVAVGCVYAAELARGLGLLADDVADRHRAAFASVGLPVAYAPDAWPDLRAAMSLDKKARGAQLRFVLLNDVASAEVVAGPPEAELEAAYARLTA